MLVFFVFATPLLKIITVTIGPHLTFSFILAIGARSTHTQHHTRFLFTGWALTTRTFLYDELMILPALFLPFAMEGREESGVA